MRANSDGVLMIVDSSDHGMIGDASAILAETTAAFGDIPLEVIANKQDRDDAAPSEDVALWLGIPNAIGMSGKNRESSKDALIRLLRKLEGIDESEECAQSASAW